MIYYVYWREKRKQNDNPPCDAWGSGAELILWRYDMIWYVSAKKMDEDNIIPVILFYGVVLLGVVFIIFMIIFGIYITCCYRDRRRNNQTQNLENLLELEQRKVLK